MEKRYTVGVDFGTLSARAALVDVQTGVCLASATMEYPHGVMDTALPDGTPLPPQYALQYPGDYLLVLRDVIASVMQMSGIGPMQIVGLGLDFTSCTVLPVTRDATPLCDLPQYRSQPHAYVKLWKHHGAQAEAERFTEVARERGELWLEDYGGKISSEWGFTKLYETLRHAPEVYRDTWRFFEAGEWLVYLLTGKESHAPSFAGYKFLWGAERGYPTDEYFSAVDPALSGVVGSKISARVDPVDAIAGRLTSRGAALTGLAEGTPLALPALDAHAGIPTLGITDPGTMMLTLGTSGVQMLHTKQRLSIPGICGCVRDAIFPGLYTYEAGQTGLGDGFDWFVKNCVPEAYSVAARESGMSIHQYLRQKAERLRVGESHLLALDWLNGNRSTLQDADLSCAIVGLTIATRPEEIYRALIESTAYGMRRILETFEENGAAVERIRASGGIAKKDPMMMQIYADVTGRVIEVMETDQASALGSAIHAAAASGVYGSLREASQAMASRVATTYTPIAANHEAYERLYAEYCRLYDYFGKGENPVMKRLREF